MWSGGPSTLSGPTAKMQDQKSGLRDSYGKVMPQMLRVQKNAPSIPYKSTALGYELLDDNGHYLLSLGQTLQLKNDN